MNCHKIFLFLLLSISWWVLVKPDVYAADSYDFHFFTIPGALELTPHAINDNNIVVGEYKFENVLDEQYQFRGFVFDYQNNTLTSYVRPGDHFTHFFDVNNQGQVVGASSFSTQETAIIFDLGTEAFQSVHIPNASSARASGINDQGDIVGTYVPSPGGGEAGFVYQNNALSYLSHSQSNHTVLIDINNQGTIVGYYEPLSSSILNGFSYTQNQFTDYLNPFIPELTIYFRNIDNTGKMIAHMPEEHHGRGYSYIYENGQPHRFYPLPYADQPFSLEGSNSQGVLTGGYIDEQGVRYGYIAFPVEQDQDAPVITIVSPQGELSSSSVAIEVEIVDESDIVERSYSLDDQMVETTQPTLDLTYLPLGEHSFMVKAMDAFGNEAVKTSLFTLLPTPKLLGDLVQSFTEDLLIRNLGMSLINKIKTIEIAISNQDYAEAITGLRALKHQIQAQLGKKIDPEAGQVLISHIDALLASYQ